MIYSSEQEKKENILTQRKLKVHVQITPLI